MPIARHFIISVETKLRQRGEEEEARLLEKAMYDMEAPQKKVGHANLIVKKVFLHKVHIF